MTPTIRDAVPDDAAAVARIYAPYVAETAISFETEPPGVEAMGERIARCLAGHGWLVAEREGRVVGYAYAAPFAPRVAYRLSAEVSVYVDRAAGRRGAGTALYGALLARLRARGTHTAMAGIALPNAASVAFHERHGFRHAGTFREVGVKFGRWHDVGWWQLMLDRDAPPDA